MTDINPRAVVGDNRPPDYAQQVTDRMRREYDFAAWLNELTIQFLARPAVVDDETMGVVAKLIKRLKDTAARIEAIRVMEKEPFLRGGNAVDGHCNGFISRFVRRTRSEKPGMADVAHAEVDAYAQQKLAAEQARRRREAEDAARAAREAQERADREARAAEEARLAAERARKPANIETKAAIASALEQTAADSGISAQLAASAAYDARMAALAKPADIARTRVDDALVTMPEEGYAEIIDSNLLDRDALWAHIPEEEKRKALGRWARNTGFLHQMAGASIGKRPKTAIR